MATLAQLSEDDYISAFGTQIEANLSAAVTAAIEHRASDPMTFIATHLLNANGPESENRSSSYMEQERGLATDAMAKLPKALHLQAVSACISDLGLQTFTVNREQRQLKQLEAALASLHNPSVGQRTRLEHQTNEMRSRLARAEKDLEEGISRMQKEEVETSRAIAPDLRQDEERYTEALKKMAHAEPDVLEQLSALAASLNNAGPLQSGEMCQVVVDGKLVQARVDGVDPLGENVKVSLFQEIFATSMAFEQGFDTRMPVMKTMRRVDIYADRKQRQELSAQAKDIAEQHARLDGSTHGLPARTSKLFLFHLYADAERVKPQLVSLCNAVMTSLPPLLRQGVEPIHAPLKGEPRACLKALAKYDGDYSRLTDLARTTFKCTRLVEALAVLNALSGAAEFDVLLVKDRLMLSFDASATGGYRDLLLNLRHKTLYHIVEVQITLAPLLEVKAGGGHSAYSLARTLQLFEPGTFRYSGQLDDNVLTLVSSGVVRELILEGTVHLSTHFGTLLNAFRSPGVSLRELRLSKCDWPANQHPSILLQELGHLGHRLRELFVAGMAQVESSRAELEVGLFERCSRLESVCLSAIGLCGHVPSTIGNLTQCHKIVLSRNSLDGPIPVALAKCTHLVDLWLFQNKITGPLPSEIFNSCRKLEALNLSKNPLNCTIPVDIGNCSLLVSVWLNQCGLCGPLPASLFANCHRLRELDLSNNRLEGAISEKVGTCTELSKLILSHNLLCGTVPAAALAKCSEFKRCKLGDNPHLLISAEEKEKLVEKFPNAEFEWPTVA